MIHYANYLHSIYMLLGIICNLEITGKVGRDVVYVNFMLFYISAGAPVLLYPTDVLKQTLLRPMVAV